MRELLQLHELRMPGNTFWAMAGSASPRKNVDDRIRKESKLRPNFVYQALMYHGKIEGKELVLQLLRPKRGDHGGRQCAGAARLYLKRHLDYLPAIHRGSDRVSQW